MLIQLMRRASGLGVSLFAALGFWAVPLGDKTGFEHALAIVRSAEVRALGQELKRAATGLRHRLLTDWRAVQYRNASDGDGSLLQPPPLVIPACYPAPAMGASALEPAPNLASAPGAGGNTTD